MSVFYFLLNKQMESFFIFVVEKFGGLCFKL
jgi:hypothetical protein